MGPINRHCAIYNQRAEKENKAANRDYEHNFRPSMRLSVTLVDCHHIL